MNRIAALAAFACCTLAAPAPAAERHTFSITVTAGKHARSQTPVSVPITLPAALAQVTTASLSGPNNAGFMGQVTAPGLLAESTAAPEGRVRRELHFILPSLKADQSATYKVSIPTEIGLKVEIFSWHDAPGEYTELRFGSRPVLRYVYKALDDKHREETFKVYHHLYDPTGQHLVTKGPGGLYTHHRGIFYGFMKVTYGAGKVVDIWHCKEDTYQGHEKFLAAEEGPVLGRHRVQIAWHGKGKEVFAREERELTVYQVPGGQLVEFASKVRSTDGKVKVDGDPQHAGFHFRAAQEVAEKTNKQTYYLRPDGKDKPGATRNWPGSKDHVNLPWDAMSFVLGGQRYTAAYLDKPTNPKEARFSERDYGRFGSYFVTEFTQPKPLTVNYRIWLQEGEMTGEGVATRSADFVEPVKVTVK